MTLLLLALMAAGVAAPPPQRYPAFDQDTAVRLLVVGIERPGGHLPRFPGCDGVEVLCMDPPPFWMRVRVLMQVSGPVMEAGELAVASTSHQGMPEGDRDGGQVHLLDLRREGDSFVMPRYAKAKLFQGRDGGYYLPLGAAPVPWLPCSIQSLRQEIDDVRRYRDARIRQDYWQARQVREQPQWYVVSGTDAFPRYWVPVARLRGHLAGVPAAAMHCERW